MVHQHITWQNQQRGQQAAKKRSRVVGHPLSFWFCGAGLTGGKPLKEKMRSGTTGVGRDSAATTAKERAEHDTGAADRGTGSEGIHNHLYHPRD